MRNLPTIILLLILLTIAGGLPIGLIGWLFFGPGTGQALFWLSGLLVASFIPLKLLVDSIVKDGAGFRLPNLPLGALALAGVAMIFVVPILWFATAPPFLVGVLAYIVSQQSVPIMLAAALLVQVIGLVRGSYREKASGATSSIFTQMTRMQSNFNIETVVITQDGVYRATGDAPQSAYLDAETPTQPDTITITPETDRNDQTSERS